MMLWPRDSPLSQLPPPARSRAERHPTLLFSWWCTLFSAAIILTRVISRKVRSNVLFREDWIILLSLIPLFVRMAFIHVVMLYGTNNVEFSGYEVPAAQVSQRELGSKFVLVARIFYAAFIWTGKLAVSEFLKRITIRIWNSTYERVLYCIRIFLGVTFVAVVVATLAQCQPFDHYWQVVPTAPPSCRNGYAHLLTMGITDMVTDILLVVFPIPIVLRLGRTWKVKLGTIALFSTSIALIVITGMRMPEVVRHNGRQQYRTVWASAEILASAAVCNAVVIGSFLRDKGTKKKKWRSYSTVDSMDRPSSRRPTLSTLPGRRDSDEELFRSFTGRMPSHLMQEKDDTPIPAPPVALPALMMSSPYPDGYESPPDGTQDVSSDQGDSRKGSQPFDRDDGPDPPDTASNSKKAVSFFDVGGLLDDGDQTTTRPRSQTNQSDGSVSWDFAPPPPLLASAGASRRGSRTLLSDLGGLLAPGNGRNESKTAGILRRESGNGPARNARRSSLVPSTTLKPTPESRESEEGGQQSRRHRPSSSSSSSDSSTKPGQDQQQQAATGTDFDDQVRPEVRPLAEPLLPRASFSTGASRPTLSRPPTQQSARDFGGLISPPATSAATDESDIEVQRATDQRRSQHVSGQHQPSNDSSGSTPKRPSSSDEISLHDPGGLLR